jgi:hypothetical protein
LIDLATLTTHQEHRDVRHPDRFEISHFDHGKRLFSLLVLNKSKVSVVPGQTHGFLQFYPAIQVRSKPPSLSIPALHAHSPLHSVIVRRLSQQISVM